MSTTAGEAGRGSGHSGYGSTTVVGGGGAGELRCAP